MGSMTEALRHLVRSVGGRRARETAEQVVEERQRAWVDSPSRYDDMVDFKFAGDEPREEQRPKEEDR